MLFILEKPRPKVLELVENKLKNRLEIIITSKPKIDAYNKSKMAIYIEEIISRDLARDPC